ncbi:MAG: DUF2029 domain-containing protein [Proteobacteria bacterium]|nr:DUF2029 domain-containing protein [Pseudomonadota bacterium]
MAPAESTADGRRAEPGGDGGPVLRLSRPERILLRPAVPRPDVRARFRQLLDRFATGAGRPNRRNLRCRGVPSGPVRVHRPGGHAEPVPLSAARAGVFPAACALALRLGLRDLDDRSLGALRAGRGPRRANAVPYRALALLIAPSTVLTVTMGQNGFLSAILFVGGMNLLWRAPIWAGILFGLLTFKPQLGLLIPVALLAGCHWRAVASASATAVVLLGGSLIVLGAETWELYLSTTVPFQRLIMEQWTGAMTQMVPSPFMAARLLDLGVPLGYAVQALSLLAAAAGVAWAFRGRVERELQTATVLVATFLATPYIFNYDMTLLSVAIIYLVQRGLDRGFVPGERWLLGFAWLLPVLMMYLHAIFPVAPFVLAALFAVTLYHVQQARLSTPIPAV